MQSKELLSKSEPTINDQVRRAVEAMFPHRFKTVSETSAAVTETITWKLVSFQPGFLANILTKAWQGITALSMVSTALRQKLKHGLTFLHY